MVAIVQSKTVKRLIFISLSAETQRLYQVGAAASYSADGANWWSLAAVHDTLWNSEYGPTHLKEEMYMVSIDELLYVERTVLLDILKQHKMNQQIADQLARGTQLVRAHRTARGLPADVSSIEDAEASVTALLSDLALLPKALRQTARDMQGFCANVSALDKHGRPQRGIDYDALAERAAQDIERREREIQAEQNNLAP